MTEPSVKVTSQSTRDEDTSNLAMVVSQMAFSVLVTSAVSLMKTLYVAVIVPENVSTILTLVVADGGGEGGGGDGGGGEGGGGEGGGGVGGGGEGGGGAGGNSEDTAPTETNVSMRSVVVYGTCMMLRWLGGDACARRKARLQAAVCPPRGANARTSHTGSL